MSKTDPRWLESIEPEIRPLVRLLRSQGVNTTSSCGHEMYVQCDWQQDHEASMIHDLLFNNDYAPFTIEFHIDALPYRHKRWFEIRLKGPTWP